METDSRELKDTTMLWFTFILSLVIYAWIGFMWIFYNIATNAAVGASYQTIGFFAIETVILESLIGATGTAVVAYRMSGGS